MWIPLYGTSLVTVPSTWKQ